MGNLHQSALEITAHLSKAIFFVLLIFSSTLNAQIELEEPPGTLKNKELRKFNELFFRAEKEKNIGNFKEAKDLFEELHKMNNKNATVCYELALVNAELGNSEDAISYGEKAVKLDPRNKWFKIMLASIYREFSRTEKEIEIFHELVELEPRNPDFRYELAIAYINNSEYKKAIEELNKLEEIIGVNEVLSEQKEKIYLEIGDVEGAAGEIQNLIKAFPRQLDYHGRLARIYYANGYPQKAFDIYMKMLEIAPDDPRPHLDLAEYYRQQKQYDKSLLHLKKAISSPNLEIDSKIPVLLSLFNASQNDSVLRMEAMGMLRDLLEVHPEDAKAYAIYGDYLSREGANEEALAAYKKAVSLPGGNKFEIWEQILLIEIQTENFDSLRVNGPQVIELYPNQPLPYFFTGVAFLMGDNANPDEAVYYLEDGLNYVLGNPRLKEQFYLNLADAYNRKKEYAKSDEYFEKVLALNPRNSTAMNNYAYYLSQREQKLDKALKLTEESNKLEPDNAVFLDTYAWVLYKSGRYKEALEKMEKVIALGGAESGEVLEHYGDILLANDKMKEALQQYLKAREMGSTTDEIDQKIEKLQLQ